jgi:hypothetical protein
MRYKPAAFWRSAQKSEPGGGFRAQLVLFSHQPVPAKAAHAFRSAQPESPVKTRMQSHQNRHEAQPEN